MGRGGKKQAQDMGDWHLWTEVTRSVSPLKPEKMQSLRKITPPDTTENLKSKAPNLKNSAAPSAPGKREWAPLVPHTPQQQLNAQPHINSVMRAKVADKRIDSKTKRKLTRGRTPIDATLDLHGMRQHEAHGALSHFIASAFARGRRNLLVITGKGVRRTDFAQFEQKGVLRYRVPQWLEEPHLRGMIAGIEGAGQSHGGEGALYIRLKRNLK